MVEQCRLACVGVTNNRHVGEATFVAPLALQQAGLSETVEVFFDLGDPSFDSTTLDFGFGFTTTKSTADTAALLRLLVGEPSPETRQSIAQEREFDLCLAFKRVGVLPKDVQDDCRAVDRRSAQQLFEIELLCGSQVVVEHHGVSVNGEAELFQLFDLAFADVPGVIGPSPLLDHAADLVGTRRVDQQGEFVQACLG